MAKLWTYTTAAGEDPNLVTLIECRELCVCELDELLLWVSRCARSAWDLSGTRLWRPAAHSRCMNGTNSFRDPMSDHPKCRPTMDVFRQCICLSVTPSTINFQGRENCQVYSRSFPSLLCLTRAHHHSSPKYISSDYIWRSIIDHLLYMAQCFSKHLMHTCW